MVFGALGLLISGSLAAVVGHLTSAHLRRDLNKELSELAGQMRDELDHGMFERWRDIQIAASLDTIRDPASDMDAKRAVLQKLQATYPDYAIVALIGPDGRVVATSNRLLEGRDVSEREYFIHGRSGPFVGDVHNAVLLAKLLPRSDDEPARFLDIAAPVVRPDGSVCGVLVAHLYWSWAEGIQTSLLKSLGGHSAAEILVLAKDGTVLLGPRSVQGQRLSLTSIKEAQNGKTGTVQERWPDGKSYLTGFDRSEGYRDYPGLGWIVLVREDVNAAFAPTHDLQRSIIVTTLVAVLLSILLSMALARWITRPLRRLTAATEARRGSSLDRLPSVGGYEEVNLLCRSLNALFEERDQREAALIAAHSAARDKEASFRLLFKSNPIPMFVCSAETLCFFAVNNAALTFYGHTREQFSSMTLLDIRPVEEHDRLRKLLGEMEDSYEADCPWRHLKRDGTERQVLTYCRRLDHGGVSAFLVAVLDITDRLRAEAELRRTRTFLDAVVESMPAMLTVKDARDLRFVLVNQTAEKLLGFPRSKMLGKCDYDIFPKEQADYILRRDRDILSSGEMQVIPEESIQTGHNGVRLLATKKLALRDAAGEPEFLLVMSEDITERREAEARIVHMAHHDSLTGLANRVLFREYLDKGLAWIQRTPGQHLAVVNTDLDNFKDVNDTLGHPVGDLLLVEVAQRLRKCLQEGDMIARFGGDEFAIVKAIGADCDPVEAVRVFAAKILQCISEPLEVEGHAVVIGTSMGISIASDHAIGSDQLFKNADLALYRAKADGRGTYRFFEPEMEARMQARRALEADLRKALANDEFEVFYQPMVRLSSGAVTGVEALLRWRHPVRGMVSPLDFIPIAEETGLIAAIGRWVLRQACDEVASWPGALRVAVNVSPVQFKLDDLAEAVAVALRESGLPGDRLELEITETALLQEHGPTMAKLEELSTRGVRLSLDDFGTGYSSLSYLRKYRFDKIKIDQSFVRELSSQAESQAIVHAVIGLGVALGMVVTAEGVETEDQLTLLRAAGCGEAQGYLFSRPLPAAEIRRFIAELKAAA